MFSRIYENYFKKISFKDIKKIINIHPSLLPKFKGLKTFSRVIKNNEKKTGCTVHHVNENLDSGCNYYKKIFFYKKMIITYT